MGYGAFGGTEEKFGMVQSSTEKGELVGEGESTGKQPVTTPVCSPRT